MEQKQFTRPSANILLEAASIQERKSQDYQNPLSRVRQADHYPRGVYTILDTVNGKLLRMYSVLETMEHGGKVNFESVEDSALDAINYLSFAVAYMRGEIDGQTEGKDIFNRRVSKQTHAGDALIPQKFKSGGTVGTATPFSNMVNYLTTHPTTDNVVIGGGEVLGKPWPFARTLQNEQDHGL
jgi:hypothetical protein